MALERISRAACFGGWQEVWSHPATSLGCPMRFGLYLPPAAEQGPVPTLLFLCCR
jgi:S-formylglutathione hydrolase